MPASVFSRRQAALTRARNLLGWQGFIGGGILTIIFAFLFPLLLVHFFPFLVCPCEVRFLAHAAAHERTRTRGAHTRPDHPPPQDLTTNVLTVNCAVPPVFQPTVYGLPSWLSLFSTSVTLLPIQVPSWRSVAQSTAVAAREPRHERRLGLRVCTRPTPVLPRQLHGLCLGTFASIVAPFGGFFASAIKRAYNLKDFSAIIPGHGAHPTSTSLGCVFTDVGCDHCACCGAQAVSLTGSIAS